MGQKVSLVWVSLFQGHVVYGARKGAEFKGVLIERLHCTVVPGIIDSIGAFPVKKFWKPNVSPFTEATITTLFVC